MILPSTAAKNGGLCATCAKLSAESRVALKEHRRRLATGELYWPSPEELASARQSAGLVAPDSVWKLEPEFYADQAVGTVPDAIRLAERELRGHVFLVNDLGARLNLSFTEQYAVCTFQDPNGEAELYARTSACLNTQVPEQQHVVSACPCCGVGTGWFPSRFHMPREVAFELLLVMTTDQPGQASWLPTGDYTLTVAGKG